MISGFYCSATTSESVAGILHCTDDGEVSVEGSNKQPLNIASVTISPRIGNTARYIEFPDGSVFETKYNDRIDQLIKLHIPSHFHGLAHRLESSRNIILLSLLLTVVTGWAFVQFGVPYFSREVAYLIPDEYVHKLGSGVLEQLDDRILKETTLSTEQQNIILGDFANLVEFTGSEDLNLVFRNSSFLGPNAFALPDGTIILTDELVEISQNRDEIISILLHEIGHIENRHSLRIALQGFSLALFVSVVSGDVSTSSAIISGIPALVIETGYSRDMETEADSYALYFLLNAEIDPGNFANVMVKIEASHNPEYQQCIESDTDTDQCLNNFYTKMLDSSDPDFSRYFSSHPGTMERIERFLENHEPEEMQ